jgi:hypothetical protein
MTSGAQPVAGAGVALDENALGDRCWDLWSSDPEYSLPLAFSARELTKPRRCGIIL